MTLGTSLARLRTPVPGPRSRELGERLARVESRNITRIGDRGPIFWAEAAGANVRDVDDNVFVDLTAGFGVAAAGHANDSVTRSIGEQARRLTHAMGDVHPAAVKVELLERLARLAPGPLAVAILSSDGGDAVESAWKTAALATGRPGAIAFEGAYHGLGLGALALTSGRRFRAPFQRQLYGGVRFAPFPDADRDESGAPALEAVGRLLEESAAADARVGAVFVEPIQGRAGIVVPPADFLPGLSRLCREAGVLLVADEIYTGLGRTGRWFACEHWEVVPDLLVIGKSLGGGLPLSAVLGSPELMRAWPVSEGEAIHTSTFLGNPVACAAALAQLRVIEDTGLVDRARGMGGFVRSRFDEMSALAGVAGGRGLGLMQALVLEGPDASTRAAAVADAALSQGVIVLSEGPALAITPPLVITETQLAFALDVLGSVLAAPA